MYNSPRQTQYDSILQQNLAAVEAARREHLRVLRNAQRAREILDAENERLRQLEELQTQEDLRRIAEERVEIARAQEELAQAELQARQRAEDIERRPTPQPPPPPPKPIESPQPPPPSKPEGQQPTPAGPSQRPTPEVQAPSRQPKPEALPEPAPPKIHATATNPTPATSQSPHQAEHQRFLDLHQRLKDLRSNVTTQFKGQGATAIATTYGDLKITTLGDLRREVKKRVTQLTTDTKQNMISITATKTLLTKARNMANGPKVDASQFLVSHQLPPGTDPTISALFLFLLSTFSKCIIKKFALEASEVHRSAEPVGIAAITIFANPDLRLSGTPFIDILLAKYHKVCPILFTGVSGSERTEKGRERLGWAKEDGAWISEQIHFERMTGLGAGFGALSLRDFSKARSSNPLPAHYYWMALARILNLSEVTRTHCVLVKALVEMHVEKFIGFYGAAAVALLKVAVREFPERVGEKSSESTALAACRVGIEQTWRLAL